MDRRRRPLCSFDIRASPRLDHLSVEKSRPRTGSAERAVSVNVRRRSVLSISPIAGLSSRQLSSLFKCRCKDLNIGEVPDQEVRFLKTCASNIKNRKFVLSNLQLSLSSSVAIGKILSDSSAFSMIDLSGNSFGDEGCAKICKSIKKNNSIVHLCLSSNDLSAEGSAYIIKSLSKHPSLVSIDLSSVESGLRNKMCLMGAHELGKSLLLNGILAQVNVSNTLIDNDGFEYIVNGLRGNTHLVSLNLACNSISNVKEFAAVLPTTNIEYLNLASNALGDTGSKYLGKAVVYNEENNNMLSLIDLSGNSITYKGLAYLLSGIRKNASISTLKLNDNDFSEGLSAEFIDCLQQSYCLKKLSLAKCKISDLGFLTICHGLAVNKSLKILNIAKNNFTLSERIVTAFQANSTLEKLNLSNNNIKERDMQHINDMIKANKGLKQLNLSENRLKTESALLLLEACRVNSQIYSINLELNIIDPSVLHNIKDVLRKNYIYYYNNIVPKLKGKINKLKFEPSRIDALNCKAQRVETAKKRIEIRVNNIRIEDIKEEEEEKTLQVFSERKETKQKFQDTSKSLTDLMESTKVTEARYMGEIMKIDKEIDRMDRDITHCQKIKTEVAKEKNRIQDLSGENTKDLHEQLLQEEEKFNDAKNALEQLQLKLEQQKKKLAKKTNNNTGMYLASSKLAEVKKESPNRVKKHSKTK